MNGLRTLVSGNSSECLLERLRSGRETFGFVFDNACTERGGTRHTRNNIRGDVSGGESAGAEFRLVAA